MRLSLHIAVILSLMGSLSSGYEIGFARAGQLQVSPTSLEARDAEWPFAEGPVPFENHSDADAGPEASADEAVTSSLVSLDALLRQGLHSPLDNERRIDDFHPSPDPRPPRS